MPQLSPLNWAFISVMILFCICTVKVFFSFLSVVNLNFLNPKKNSSTKFHKWNW